MRVKWKLGDYGNSETKIPKREISDENSKGNSKGNFKENSNKNSNENSNGKITDCKSVYGERSIRIECG